jgi:aminoglycoside phosphotransferase (APT) family kinase protein
VGQIDALLAAGCLDRRLDRLASAVPALLAALDERDGLDPAEIAALRAAEGRLVALCAELASYRVPPALLHGDLHENNIAIAATGPLIFDWSDACIAHPFLDLVTLLDPEGTPLAPDERARLRDLYLSYWTGYEPLERLRAVAALAEPVGLLHQTLSYEQIMAGVEPGARWQYAWGFRYFARRLLAALADPAAAAW